MRGREAVIVIPFRGDQGGFRDRNFAVVLPRIEWLGYRVVIGDSGDRPFSIARTWNQLAREAEPWDVLVRWGADFLIEDADQVHEAIALVEHRSLLFDEVTHLTRAETVKLHREPELLPERNQTREQGKRPFGGPNVTTREAWEAVGGFDERFIGYGYEDVAHVRRIEELYGPRQTVPGRMLNLWHPKPAGAYGRARARNRELLSELGYQWRGSDAEPES